MKFIFVCGIVCAIALNQSVDFGQCSPNVTNWSVSTQPTETFDEAAYQEHYDRNFSDDKFKKEVQLNYKYMVAIIALNAWRVCRQTMDVTFRESLDVFINEEIDEFQVSRGRKCFVDCMMRRMNLMVGHGLDDDGYMEQIETLRLRYRGSESIFERRLFATKVKMWDTITQLSMVLASQDNCYLMNDPDRLMGNPVLCRRLIDSYREAAHVCRDSVHPSGAGDRCETSWMILQCMYQVHRQRHYKAPFYPLPLSNNEVWLEVLDLGLCEMDSL